MTVPLPYSLGGAITAWSVQDWTAPVQTAVAAADGTARVEFPALDDGVMWLIDRAVVSCSASTGANTTVRLYDSTVAARQLLSGSAAGNFDEAEYPSGLLIRSSASLVAVWTGCTPGATVNARLQARVLRRAS